MVLTAYLNIFLIFALMFIGYFLTYKQWFTDQVGDTFSKLILQIALPCSMFLNITENFSRQEFLQLFDHSDLIYDVDLYLKSDLRATVQDH